MKALPRNLLFLATALLLGAAVIMGLRCPHTTIGARLLAAFEKSHPSQHLRAALPILDDLPDPAEVRQIAAEEFTSGVGYGPGRTALTETDDARWIAGPGFEFLWRPHHLSTLSIDDPQSQRQLADAFYASGVLADKPHDLTRTALSEIHSWTGEQQLLHWIQADRALLARTDDPVRAAREALLLLQPSPDGIILHFASDQHNFYAWSPADQPRLCQLAAFDSRGQQLFLGHLTLIEDLPPARTRLLLYTLALRATNNLEP